MDIPKDVTEIIRLYSWILPKYSMHCINATKKIAQAMDQFFNNPKNQCPYSIDTDDDLNRNILKYIYIRGGAIRDCYLLRKINDIDLVIDSHSLSKQYLYHLQKYHSNIEQHENENCKCIFFRHYLNKFKSESEIDVHPEIKWLKLWGFGISGKTFGEYTQYDQQDYECDAGELFRFITKISNSDFLLNCRFFLDILIKSELRISVESTGHHWQLYLYNNKEAIYRNKKISFDIIDECSNSYGQFKTFQQYNKLYGIDNVENAIFEINKYYISSSMQNKNEILVPLHPFPVSILYYDFTINAMHINLYCIINNGQSDLNWANKAIKTTFDQELYNEYNKIAIKDMNAKVLRCPSLQIINQCTATFYFWRLVKMAQKFINFIEKKVWKIDKKYLKHTIKHYKLWINGVDVFAFKTKFLKWNIDDKQDIIDRLHVFRYIKFEKHFKKILNDNPNLLRYAKEWSRIEKECFYKFGYDRNLLEIPRRKTWREQQLEQCERNYDHWIQHYQNKWLMQYNYFYNFYNKPTKRQKYSKYKKRWKRTKSKNKKKVKAYHKKKNDRKQNITSIMKFKSRYALTLQY